MTLCAGPSIAAEFSSFEDFSSRMILLPLHDDECTGARVESHIFVIPTACAVIDERVISKVVEEEEGAVVESRHLTNEQMPRTEGNESYTEDDSAELLVNATQAVDKYVSTNNKTMNSYQLEPSSIALVQQQHQHCGTGTSVQVPVGYVLVKIISPRNDGEHHDTPANLQSMDFTDILSFVRRSAFPLTLEFTPPSEALVIDVVNSSGTSATDAIEVETEPSNNDDECTRAETNDNESSQPLSMLVSRDDAAKLAKQAATELRGRFSRWGYQAATLAVDAASQVKELRDERQRKIKDEYQDRDRGIQSKMKEVIGALVEDGKEEVLLVGPPDVDEVTDDRPSSKQINSAGPCSIFIQTSLGFDQIQTKKLSPITNNTVISVRLSKDEACPLGKNGYTFQWCRSNIHVGTTSNGLQQSDAGESNYNAQSWTFLRGACYPAYQPSVSDIGYRLRCIVKSNDTLLQSCILPCHVTMEQSQLDYAHKSLLGGTKSVTFGPLQRVDNATVYRIKIVIVTHGDFISNSSIFIDSTTNDAVDNKSNDLEPVLHYRVAADPAMPRRFDLISSSHGRITLDAANRKSRESLVFALGLANHKGSLSSLTTETALFPSFQYERSISKDEDPPAHSKQSALFGTELTEMNHLLLSKDFTIWNIHHELVKLNSTKQELEISLNQYHDSERVLKEEIERYKVTAIELAQTIEDINHSYSHANAAQEKALIALNNEKAVLVAAIEARDGKIDSLKNQITELTKRSSMQSERHSTIESLRSDLLQMQNKYASAGKVIAEMKAKESELQKKLTSAQENASMLASECIRLKQIASKYESDFNTLKVERKSLRTKVDGLSKEISRVRTNNSDSSEVEKLNKLIRELNTKNTDLRDQLEGAKFEKRQILDALDATSLAHQQSVRFQISTDARNGARVPAARIMELESVISSMAETLNAKDMQLETLKQINKALLEGEH